MGVPKFAMHALWILDKIFCLKFQIPKILWSVPVLATLQFYVEPGDEAEEFWCGMGIKPSTSLPGIDIMTIKPSASLPGIDIMTTKTN